MLVDLPAVFVAGLCSFLVAAERFGVQLGVGAEAVGGAVGVFGTGRPAPILGDGDGAAGAAGMRLGGDLVSVAVAQVGQVEFPGNSRPVTVDMDALPGEVGGERDLGLPLGPAGAELLGGVVEPRGPVLGGLD